MPVGLPQSKVVQVSVNITPAGASFLNLNSLLIMGNTDVIDTVQRLRLYSSLTEVAIDFATNSPEYLAAQLYFAQSPQPTQLYIGRWAQSATHGKEVGGPLSAAQQALSNFTAVANGGFKITVDGGAQVNVSGINLTGAANLNAVASLITTALSGAGVGATCAFVVDTNGNHFIFTSNTTGVNSAVAPLVAPAAGTDISGLLNCTAATDLYPVQGVGAESAVAAVTVMDNLPTQWYGLMFASASIVDADHQAIAAYVQGSTVVNPHLYGLTTSEATALSSADSTSIGFLLKQTSGLNRTFVQWSSSSPYAVASMFGRLLTVNPDENNSTITLMFKGEPLVAAETLTTAQAAALDASNYNYFANFSNGTAIIVNGITSGGQFIDTMWGVDWEANQIQTDVYNLLFTSPTKIPQTDAGMHQILTTIEQACAAGVNNGLLAPGTWNSAGFGQLQQGQFLDKGYYVFVPPLATQPQATRAKRQTPPFQVALKLAGAVHDVVISVNVNQ